jgi:hypothetical protein
MIQPCVGSGDVGIIATITDGLRGSRLPPDHPASRDSRRQTGRAQAADLRTRRMALRRIRLQPEGCQVALPDQRMQARVPLDQGDRLHPLVPRETPRWWKLYKGRAAVEREFGRLKNEWALLPLRVRGLERVQLHADLTILAKLSCALARARAAPLAA